MSGNSSNSHKGLLAFIRELIKRYSSMDRRRIVEILDRDIYYSNGSSSPIIDPFMGIDVDKLTPDNWRRIVDTVLLQASIFINSPSEMAKFDLLVDRGNQLPSDDEVKSSFSGDAITIKTPDQKFVVAPTYSDALSIKQEVGKGNVPYGSKLAKLADEIVEMSKSVSKVLNADALLHHRLRMAIAFFNDYVAKSAASSNKLGFYTFLLNHPTSSDPASPLYLTEQDRENIMLHETVKGDVYMFNPLSGDASIRLQGIAPVIIAAIVTGVLALGSTFLEGYMSKEKDAVVEKNASVLMAAGASQEAAVNSSKESWSDALENERIYMRTTTEGSRIKEWSDRYVDYMTKKNSIPSLGLTLHQSLFATIKQLMPDFHKQFLSKAVITTANFMDKVADYSTMIDAAKGPYAIAQWLFSQKLLPAMPTYDSLAKYVTKSAWAKVVTTWQPSVLSCLKEFNKANAVICRDAHAMAKRIEAYPGVYYNMISAEMGEFKPDDQAWVDKMWNLIAKLFKNSNPASEENENAVIPVNPVVNNSTTTVDTSGGTKGLGYDPKYDQNREKPSIIITPDGVFVKTGNNAGDLTDLVRIGAQLEKAREAASLYYPSVGDPTVVQGVIPMIAGLAVKAAGMIGKKIISKIKEKAEDKSKIGTSNPDDKSAGLGFLGSQNGENMVPTLHPTGLWAPDDQIIKDNIKGLLSDVSSLKTSSLGNEAKLEKVLDQLAVITTQLHGIDVKVSMGTPNIVNPITSKSNKMKDSKKLVFLGDFAEELGALILSNSSSSSSDESGLSSPKAYVDNDE